jgi:hypothetical protein
MDERGQVVEVPDTAIDKWRDLRVSAGLLVVAMFALFGLFRSITMAAQLAEGPVTDFYLRRILFQVIADGPFTVAAVLAVRSIRARERVRSRQLLQWAAAALALALGLLFLELLTAPQA